MAETFTNDNSPETEVLTDEDQNSLEVGEKLVAEQEQLLAGKYKSAKDLEQAYLSLQKKLGQEETEEEGEGQEEGVDEEVSEDAPAVSLINEASAEYYSNDGNLSEETIQKFSNMSSQDLVAAYLEIQANNPQAAQQAVAQTSGQPLSSDPDMRKLEQVESARDPSQLLKAQMILQARQKSAPNNQNKKW